MSTPTPTPDPNEIVGAVPPGGEGYTQGPRSGLASAVAAGWTITPIRPSSGIHEWNFETNRWEVTEAAARRVFQYRRNVLLTHTAWLIGPLSPIPVESQPAIITWRTELQNMFNAPIAETFPVTPAIAEEWAVV